ncbi:MAG TPA: diguanylate cyclase [Myxococcaceae bacterium]|nr:diguanylate cyclase [Myxococcaceae bacterium]
MSLALIAEPSAPVSGALKKFLEGAGFGVKVAKSLDEALGLVREVAPDILFAASSDVFDGARLCQEVKQVAPHVPVVLVYAPDVEDPDPEAARAGADAYLVGPLKRGTVVSCAKTMLRVRSLMVQLERLEADLKGKATEARAERPALGEPPKTVAEPDKREPERKAPEADATTDFDFFKRLLLMEVKRSRRYRYPVAFLLVGLDRFSERIHNSPAHERTVALTEALRIVSKAVRDIDLAVPFSEGRFLVFLPHTPRNGALIVATRIRERLAKMESLQGQTASVGVAAYEPGPGDAQVSFGGLMKEATESLRKAQVAGGDRVEAGEKTKRDRISLG